MKSRLLLYINIHVHTLVPSPLLPYTNIRNMIFKRMRNDQCSKAPPGSIIFSAIQSGSASKKRAKMPTVKLLLQQAYFLAHQATFSAAKKAPTSIEMTKTYQTSHAPRVHLGSTKTIPSTVNPQSANSAHLASSRRIAQQ